MKIVTDLSLTSAPHRPRVGWSPARLFSGGALGAWFDPADTGTLFQDTAGTVAVAADSDPVALMLDKSGNGKHAVQPVPAARPTWRTDGALAWLEFDGVDDKLVINDAGHASDFGLCIGLQYESGGTKFGSWRSRNIDTVYVGLSHATIAGAVTDQAGVTLTLNGASAPGSRDTLRAATLSAGVGVATNIPPSGFSGYTWQMFGYSSPGAPAGKLFGYVEAGTLDLGTANAARLWMAGRAGVVA